MVQIAIAIAKEADADEVAKDAKGAKDTKDASPERTVTKILYVS